jgi:hypothetical protein
MSDEKETKLPQDELKQVAGGEAAATELSPEELNNVAGGNLAADVLNAAAAGAAGGGKIKFNPFSIAKTVDKSSPIF